MVGSYTVLQVALQESDDNSTSWTALADTPVSLAIGLTNTVEGFNAFKRSKRYIRAVITETSGTSVYVAVTLIGRLKITGSGSGTQL